MKKLITLALVSLSTISLTACVIKPVSKNDSSSSEAKMEQKTSASSKESLSTGYKNALEQAKYYLEIFPSSKEGLKKKLIESEEFSKDEVQAAIDEIADEVDWKANAVKKAETYLKTVHFSKYKLLSHLSGYEKFTQEEAAYAVEHVKADWNLQALEKARDFRKYGNRSPEEIKKRLVEFEYFTEQEANYAIEHLDQ
ncbi:Ltp family lipoprotein [Streptococcus rubneri]|jgi:surface lipoprotein-related family protein|uniref:Ltp family lipoprotein n=2 Tax=Streptococcus rubneri TaxID=1234680 RepID=UPI00189FFC75|nr:Ltp family lipoprotein [Streptococcus rubneri]